MKIAHFTVIASFLLSCALFLAFGQLGDIAHSIHLVLALHLLCNPLIILAFLSFGVGGGTIAVIFFSLFGSFISVIAGWEFYPLTPTSFLITGVVSYILLKKEQDFQQQSEIDRERLEAEHYAFREEQVKSKSQGEGWRKKMLKYSLFREITESLSSSLSLEEILSLVTDSALYIIGKGETVLLFLTEEGRLALKAASGRGDSFDSKVRIKAKTGDIFDKWVIRQKQDLIVTDGEKDFRFRTLAKGEGEREIKSLISSPLLWGEEVRGILRLDSSSPDEYTADDLRLLDTVAGLASLALENAELYQRTEELAIRDNLTGLYVHKYFQDRLEEELKRALARDYPLSLVMLDIDYFKDYNDRFGHIAGDIVLRHLAGVLTEETAAGNLAARYGGEEFCLLLPQTDKEKACRLAERIRKKVAENTITLRRIKTKITVSLGVAALPQDARTRADLIRKADEALYRAKEKGKNQVCI